MPCVSRSRNKRRFGSPVSWSVRASRTLSRELASSSAIPACSARISSISRSVSENVCGHRVPIERLPTVDTVGTDRNGHRRPQAVVDQRRGRVRRIGVVLDHDAAILAVRLPADAEVGARGELGEHIVATHATRRARGRLGSDGSRRRRHTTVSPKSCVVPSTIATSTSSSGARREIELWIRTSRERNRWRSWSSLRNARLCWSSCNWVSRFDRRRSSCVRLRKQTTTPLMPGTPRRLVRSRFDRTPSFAFAHAQPQRSRPSSSAAISANRSATCWTSSGCTTSSDAVPAWSAVAMMSNRGTSRAALLAYVNRKLSSTTMIDVVDAVEQRARVEIRRRRSRWRHHLCLSVADRDVLKMSK